MEDIRAYIESGILELYVLGDLNPEEKSEVEAMSKLYPEVKAELEEIESMMMKISSELSAEPSLKAKESFFSHLTFSDEHSEAVEAQQIANNPTLSEVGNDSKVVSINSGKLNFYKYSFAASLALLVLSILAIVNLSTSLKDSRQQIAQLQTSNQTFANRVNYLDEKLVSSDKSLEVLTNPDFKMVTLKGTDKHPNSSILVAFNPKEQKVMLDFTNMKMPKNDESTQYQLWALVDGKPVDLGVFDMESGVKGLKDMKSISTAQTFAVTLEPKGGSVNPTLENLMVIGNI